MIDIPLEDFVFVVCALIGGGLLLITVVLGDILGAIVHFNIGGVSLMPLLLSFISMFGVGGLFATQALDVQGGQAAMVGVAFGLVGMGIAYGLFSVLQRAEAGPKARRAPGSPRLRPRPNGSSWRAPGRRP